MILDNYMKTKTTPRHQQKVRRKFKNEGTQQPLIGRNRKK